MRAGYSTNWPQRQFDNLMKNEGIRALIEDLKIKPSFEITAVDPNYIIQRIMTIISSESARDSDKLRGLELLAKHLGMFIERQEVKTTAVVDEETRQEAQEILSTLRTLHARAKKDEREAEEQKQEESNILEFKKGA